MLAGEIKTYSLEKRYVPGGDGDPVWVSLSASLVRDDTGAPMYFISQIQDITERREAEGRLRQLSTAVEQSPASIVITDPVGNSRYVNPQFERASGYRADEVIGKTPSLLKSGRHEPFFYDEMWETLLADNRWEGEIWDRRRNGEIYPKWLSISVVRGQGGQVSHYVAAFTDVTRRANDLTREQVRIGVGGAVAFMMNVMKLANSSDARQRHLEKRHPRHVVNIFGRESIGSRIHLLAPRPKRIGRTL